MSLLQMSFTGAILILAIIVIRTLAMNKLPQKMFLTLWGVALLRLFLPFSLPSMFSVYSAIECSTPAMQAVQRTAAANFFPIAPNQAMTTIPGVSHSGETGMTISVWEVVWAVGVFACFLFFAISYIRCRREFQTSLPVEDVFARDWLAAHKTSRPIIIRQSSRIFAPLTYGVFRPVILMPKSTNWNDTKSLQYVLAHEYTHIRRFDAVTKLILTAALCIHWFNPLVWAMYLFANRDMELSCDEAVVRLFGYENRSAYARTLISMEAAKSGLTPLCNSFSKTAIEERVTAIMKIKRTSLIAGFVALVIVAGFTVVFATSAVEDHHQLSPVPGTDFTDEDRYTPGLPANDRAETGSNKQEPRQNGYGTREDYASLLALKTPNYQKMTVADFDAAMLDWANEHYDGLERICEDVARNDYQVSLTDEERSFVNLTAMLSNEENFRMIQSLKTGQPEKNPGVGGTRLWKETGEGGNFAWCSFYYQLPYQIMDKEKLTVGDRDRAIGGMIRAIQAFWDETSLNDMLELTQSDVVEKMRSLADEYSSNLITIKIDETHIQFECLDERGIN